LLKEDYIKEEISEKIRLFYVALTRAKEKMILVCSLEENNIDVTDVVDNSLREGYRCFLDIMQSIYPVLSNYIKNIDIPTLNLTKNYNLIKKTNYKTQIKNTNNLIDFVTLDVPNKVKETKHYSKEIGNIIDKDIKEKLEFGTYMHYLLEVIDFKNPDLSVIDTKYKKCILNFLNCGFDFKNCTIYKEYEFVNKDYHGVIDLLLEYQDKVIIVDYKLKNVNDDAYKEQLNGYKQYIETKLNKPVELYLYSIIENKIVQL